MTVEKSMKNGSCHIDISTCNRELWSLVVCEYWSYLVYCINFSYNLTKSSNHNISQIGNTDDNFFQIIAWIQKVKDKHHKKHAKLIIQRSHCEATLSIYGFIIDKHIGDRRNNYIQNLCKDTFSHQRYNILSFCVAVLESHQI